MMPCARILAPSVHHMAWWRLVLVGLAGGPCFCSVHSSPVRQACTWRRMNAAIFLDTKEIGLVRSCTSYRAASEWPTPRWLEMFGGPDLALRNYERSKCERGIYCSELLRYPMMDKLAITPHSAASAHSPLKACAQGGPTNSSRS